MGARTQKLAVALVCTLLLATGSVLAVGESPAAEPAAAEPAADEPAADEPAVAQPAADEPAAAEPAAAEPRVDEAGWSERQAPTANGPVTVELSFHVVDVLRVDDEAETFDFSGTLNLRWRDTRRSFDPAEEGAQEKVYSGGFQLVELDPVWYPQVVLANTAELAESQGLLLRVKPDGTCFMSRTFHASARSHLDLHAFPFDSQRLSAVFTVLGASDREVRLVPAAQPLTGSLKTLSIPEWNIGKMAVATSTVAVPHLGPAARASAVALTFDVSRKSFFLVRLVLFPLTLIVALSWTVFWMDRSSLGDRMSVSFVGILTAVAYQTMLSEIMPQIAYLTFMNAFISFSLMLMSATVLVNLAVARLDRAGREKRADLLDLRARWAFPAAFVVLMLIAALGTL